MRVTVCGSPNSSYVRWLMRAIVSIISPRSGRLDTRRIGKKQHRIAMRTALHSLIDRRQESRTPQALAAAGKLAAGKQHDEAGQILILAAQPVRRPAADRCVTQILVARVQQQLGRRVVELVGVHRAQEADLVGHFLEVRQADPKSRHPAWPTCSNGYTGPSSCGMPRMKANRLPSRNCCGQSWPCSACELRLVLEQLKLAGGTVHVQINDALRLGSEVRRPRRPGLLGVELRPRPATPTPNSPPTPQQAAARPPSDSFKKCRRVACWAAVNRK